MGNFVSESYSNDKPKYQKEREEKDKQKTLYYKIGDEEYKLPPMPDIGDEEHKPSPPMSDLVKYIKNCEKEGRPVPLKERAEGYCIVDDSMQGSERCNLALHIIGGILDALREKIPDPENDPREVKRGDLMNESFEVNFKTKSDSSSNLDEAVMKLQKTIVKALEFYDQIFHEEARETK